MSPCCIRRGGAAVAVLKRALSIQSAVESAVAD
jgi:hypothetical protein